MCLHYKSLFRKLRSHRIWDQIWTRHTIVLNAQVWSGHHPKLIIILETDARAQAREPGGGWARRARAEKKIKQLTSEQASCIWEFIRKDKIKMLNKKQLKKWLIGCTQKITPITSIIKKLMVLKNQF